MRINRRKGIIAALCAFGGSFIYAKPQKPIPGELVWSTAKPTGLFFILAKEGDGIGFLTVEYEGEQIKLTAKEIMDCLRGKEK